MYGQADLPPSIHLKNHYQKKIQNNENQQKQKKDKIGIKQNMKPFGSCHRVEGARARERWRDRWQGYRIGGRTRTWGDCVRTSTSQSNVSPPDWTLRSGTNRCRWTCSSVCRRIRSIIPRILPILVSAWLRGTVLDILGQLFGVWKPLICDSCACFCFN